MDKEIEERFVSKFVVKDKRERAYFELCSNKKRDNIIHRLFNLLDEKYAILNESDIRDEELDRFIKRYNKILKECYVIEDGMLDGKTVTYDVAFDKLINTAGDIFLICGENMVIAKEEVCFGNPVKKVLYRE